MALELGINNATGTTTNSMLDGIPCHSTNAYTDSCYTNVTALSVGYGITPTGKIIQITTNLQGVNIWHEIENTNNILEVNRDSYWNLSAELTNPFNDISGHTTGITENAWMQGGEGKDLFYTVGMGGNSTYKLDSEFGITTHTIASGTKSTIGCNWINEHMNNTNVCAIRGMRLPTWNELNHDDSTSAYVTCSGNASQIVGVPEVVIGFQSWSASASSNHSSGYWAWDTTNDAISYYSYDYHVRCVR